MMPRLRLKTRPIKLDGKPAADQGCCSEQHPWFSFRYMTANTAHSLDFLKSINDKGATLSCLLARLEELSRQPWLYWTQQPRQTGLETMPYDRLSFSPNSQAGLTKDTTMYIFRFDTYQGKGKGRIIGFKRAPCAVFHIIGYDLDFSAYEH